jgi:hypothetical protein
MYGWDKSQNWPGRMSGYCRSLLQWVEVIEVSYSQEITASCDSDKMYRINHRLAKDEGDEYFLIENRYACGFDLKLQHDGVDRSGIAIWYVDHAMLLGKNAGKDIIRYNTNKPPDDSAWPMGHARVSILQGDGFHNIEKNKDRGDEFDLFRKDSGPDKDLLAYKISNASVTMNDGSTKAYPNTKSIAYGDENPTGITIEVLDESIYNMKVKITLIDGNDNEVTAPANQGETAANSNNDENNAGGQSENNAGGGNSGGDST